MRAELEDNRSRLEEKLCNTNMGFYRLYRNVFLSHSSQSKATWLKHHGSEVAAILLMI